MWNPGVSTLSIMGVLGVSEVPMAGRGGVDAIDCRLLMGHVALGNEPLSENLESLKPENLPPNFGMA